MANDALLKILKAPKKPKQKVTRNAFLYLEPDSDQPDFAQCSSCHLFVSNQNRCAILGPDFEVKGTDSCGFWLPGTYKEDTPIKACVTPEEAGFDHREVRCENCFYGGSKCGLYVSLNKQLPDLFDLEESIEPQGCCNANTPK